MTRRGVFSWRGDLNFCRSKPCMHSKSELTEWNKTTRDRHSKSVKSPKKLRNPSARRRLKGWLCGHKPTHKITLPSLRLLCNPMLEPPTSFRQPGNCWKLL